MISLFANIFVNDFRNFKTAIRSFNSLPIEIFDEVVINIRGSYCNSLRNFLLRIIERKKLQK